jgi:hypothetical protein
LFVAFLISQIVTAGFPQDSIGAGHNNAKSRPAKGTLAWLAEKTRAEGKSELNLDDLGPTIFSYPDVETLDAAFRRNTVVVAVLLGSATINDESTIYTFRKYKLLEHLSVRQKPLSAEAESRWQDVLRTVPASLLPIGPQEFVTEEPGGTVIVNGVKITAPGEGRQSLAENSKYLLFLLFDSQEKMGGSNYGPIAFFAIDSSEIIHGRFRDYDSSEKNPLLREILEHTGGRLSKFRSVAAAAR